MYQALRFFSHSGMCWIRPMNATSSGGSSIAAGIRNTIVVWYDWLRGVRTTKSCATAATLRMTKVVQPGVCGLRCERHNRHGRCERDHDEVRGCLPGELRSPSAGASTSWRIGPGPRSLPSPPRIRLSSKPVIACSPPYLRTACGAARTESPRGEARRMDHHRRKLRGTRRGHIPFRGTPEYHPKE